MPRRDFTYPLLFIRFLNSSATGLSGPNVLLKRRASLFAAAWDTSILSFLVFFRF